MNERIKELRLKLGLSQEDFGGRLGVGRGAITNIELNKVEPKPLFVDLICEQFRVNEKWLLTGEGEMLRQLSEDEELELIFDQIHMSTDPTIRDIIRAYWKLPDNAKAAVRQFILDADAQIKNAGDESPGEK